MALNAPSKLFFLFIWLYPETQEGSSKVTRATLTLLGDLKVTFAQCNTKSSMPGCVHDSHLSLFPWDLGPGTEHAQKGAP